MQNPGGDGSYVQSAMKSHESIMNQQSAPQLSMPQALPQTSLQSIAPGIAPGIAFTTMIPGGGMPDGGGLYPLGQVKQHILTTIGPKPDITEKRKLKNWFYQGVLVGALRVREILRDAHNSMYRTMTRKFFSGDVWKAISDFFDVDGKPFWEWSGRDEENIKRWFADMCREVKGLKDEELAKKGDYHVMQAAKANVDFCDSPLLNAEMVNVPFQPDERPFLEPEMSRKRKRRPMKVQNDENVLTGKPTGTVAEQISNLRTDVGKILQKLNKFEQNDIPAKRRQLDFELAREEREIRESETRRLLEIRKTFVDAEPENWTLEKINAMVDNKVEQFRLKSRKYIQDRMEAESRSKNDDSELLAFAQEYSHGVETWKMQEFQEDGTRALPTVPFMMPPALQAQANGQSRDAQVGQAPQVALPTLPQLINPADMGPMTAPQVQEILRLASMTSMTSSQLATSQIFKPMNSSFSNPNPKSQNVPKEPPNQNMQQ
eukprot:TRINITY_DN3308_c0_g1_i12.p1 TRINITY_DN3308_c0_g1~~TRINITY_DN3308_c0_g1_i12.p1  ORF type:complete len:489 (-),score=133.83 TRINITY_DN3308_c0_g1_i12:1237-2703(-)